MWATFSTLNFITSHFFQPLKNYSIPGLICDIISKQLSQLWAPIIPKRCWMCSCRWCGFQATTAFSLHKQWTGGQSYFWIVERQIIHAIFENMSHGPLCNRQLSNFIFSKLLFIISTKSTAFSQNLPLIVKAADTALWSPSRARGSQTLLLLHMC